LPRSVTGFDSLERSNTELWYAGKQGISVGEVAFIFLARQAHARLAWVVLLQVTSKKKTLICKFLSENRGVFDIFRFDIHDENLH
jgi:hypothetical protein